MRIISCVGTRPQYIKLAPMLQASSRYPLEHYWIDLKQHYTSELSTDFYQTLGIGLPKWQIEVGINTQGNVIRQHTHMMELHSIFEEHKPDVVLAYGDCNSTWIAAETAYWMDIRVGHIEAGLRNYDNSKEEKVRKLTDSVATWNFCPTQSSLENVDNGIFVGDILYDSFLCYYPKVEAYSENYEKNPHYDILLTIHRDTNMTPEFLKSIFSELKASGKRVYFACHPKTHSIIMAYRKTVPWRNEYPNITKADAIDYFKVLSLLKVVDEVWTDSGGLIREAYWAGKKIRSLRDRTEWDIDIAGNASFGDGKACYKILDIVSK